MNYIKIYNNLITRAQNRILDGYVEVHHILPRCLNGNNDLANLVALTPEEHYLAHQLLVKIHPGNHKLVYAVIRLSGSGGRYNKFRNNKLYGWIKRERAKVVSEQFLGKKLSDEHCNKISTSKKGVPHSKDHCAGISKSKLGKKFSESHKNAMSAARLAKTPEEKQAASDKARETRKINKNNAIITALIYSIC